MVGEDPKVDPPVSCRTQSIKFVVIGDPKDTSIYFFFETFAKARSGLFVICNRIEKFIFGLWDKNNIHGARRLSASSITSRYEIPAAAPLSTALILS